MELFIEILLPILLFSYLATGGFKKNEENDPTILDEEKIISQIPHLPKSFQEIIEKNVWSKLLNLHESKGWKYGVFEAEKYVEFIGPIEENNLKHYFHMIHDNCLHFKVRLIENFPVEVTTDLFILTTHFNNSLVDGILTVNVKDRGVVYTIKNELDLYSNFPEKIERDLSLHYFISQDIFWAFNKYLNEREDPAFIFAEFMEMINKKEL
jgi:hypothetical protein